MFIITGSLWIEAMLIMFPSGMRGVGGKSNELGSRSR